MMYDIKIIDAKYYDYDEEIFKVTDICIKDGKIEYIGKTIMKGKTEINGAGFITSPGFIDIHMHEEELNKYDSGQKFYIGERMLNMGVTTVMGGNCGMNLHDPEEFIQTIKQEGAPVNYCLQIGYNNLREKHSQLGNLEKTPDAVKALIQKDIKRLLSLGMKGISFGIEYSPGIQLDEMVEATRLLDPDKHFMSAHFRADTTESKASVEEIIEVSRQTGVPVQVSHIGSCSGYGQMEDSLQSIREAIAEGLAVSADCYPYHAFSTFIGSEVFSEGCIEKWQTTYDKIMLTEEPYKNTYCTKEIFHKARQEYPHMLAVGYVMKEDEIVKALQEPYMMVASDGFYHGDKGHPRGAGTFPRVLGKYVREDKVMTLEDALYKMTKLPAKKLKLSTKGSLKIGYDADITIFNPDKIIDKADFIEDPTAPPVGIEHVIVNGVLSIHHQKRTAENAGTFV